MADIYEYRSVYFEISASIHGPVMKSDRKSLKNCLKNSAQHGPNKTEPGNDWHSSGWNFGNAVLI